MTLPHGWALTTVSEVGDLVTGTTPDPKRKDYYGGAIPFVKPADLDGEDVLRRTLDMVTTEGAAQGRLLPPGTVLVSCIGNLGKSAQLGAHGISNQQINAVVPRQGIEPSYVLYWARTLKSWLEQNSSATTIAIVNKGRFASAPFPLAPSQEQGRIVAKLDAIFEQTRAAKARLARLPALLDKLKRSILADAFRGDLTAEWRALRPVDSESAAAEGRLIPPGWKWVTVADVTTHVVDCLHRTPAYQADGYPAIRTADVIPGRLLVENARRVSRKTYLEQVERLVPSAGDVLYTREGERFGLAALVPEDVELCLSQRMMQFRVSDRVTPGYFMWALNSPAVYDQAVDDVGGSTSPHVNIRSIKRFRVPLAPLPEQAEIARLVERAWALVEALEGAVAAAQQRLAAVEASALSLAFRGELVPQDPNDEPAEKLLERIRAARAAKPEKPRRGRGKARSTETAATPVATSNDVAEAGEAEPVELVAAAFQNGETRLRAGDIADATGLDRAVVKDALETLVAGGQLRVEGKARGTTYVWTA